MQSAPPGWNKTLANLMKEVEEGRLLGIGSPETDWARDYERSLLPQHVRFPQKGDIYEAHEDVPVQYMVSRAAAPVTARIRNMGALCSR